jgi:hypothetical protein
MTRPVQHHLVSAGYQRNFGTADRRLDIVDPRSGEVIKLGRAIRRNWRREHWHSVIDPTTGSIDTELEETFAKLESRVLDEVRRVRIGHLTPEQVSAIINLFAIHIARSEMLRLWSDDLSRRVLPNIIREVSSSPEARVRFEAQFGRPPEAGELDAIAQQISDQRSASGEWRRDTIAHNHDGVVDRLTSLHVQIVEVDDSLPGLAIGDVPVVHANLGDGRFGYRDRLAIGDADLIMGPLTRRALACFSATRDANVCITTKRKLNDVISLLVRASVREVACHPDDRLNLQRVCRNPPPLRRP